MLLSLETSSSLGSWALFQNRELIDSASFRGRASSALFQSLASSRHPISQQALTQILIGVGPGSFSGIRVAIATAQGLAQVTQARLIPIRSSSALAWKHQKIAKLGIFADAKRNQTFLTRYQLGTLLEPSHLIPNSERASQALDCDLALSPDPLPGIPQHEPPSACDLARFFFHHQQEPDLTLEPIYLHPAIVPMISLK
ncbi:MAG: tRNA (adenosine(37)-N6)-threonylcarbamoyltransferase complex dimerization subunit type 1 TsaB [Blastochloris sp.]|nr:tRNA (adenosine(37)-N6)-threonylcarbamoyltransferase complex dimerization subunit type 1 TsaB [Blastochloris sp.]